MKIADRNFRLFTEWLKVAFPPESKIWRVYATPIGDGATLRIYHHWQYGSVTDEKTVATLPVYPMFDPNFDPAIFYQNQLVNDKPRN